MGDPFCSSYKNLAPAGDWQLLSKQDAISRAAENLNVPPESQAATIVRQRIENAHKEVVILIIVGSNLTHSGKVLAFIPAGENTYTREGEPEDYITHTGRSITPKSTVHTIVPCAS